MPYKVDLDKLEEDQREVFRNAMLGHKRIPTREGGVEIVVKELAVRMAAKGHHVDAYNRWDIFTKNGKVGNRKYFGVRIRQIPTLHNSKLNAMIYSILASVRSLFGRYDVIHYHAIGSCAMIWISHIFGKRTVATVHGLDWQRAKWGGFATKYLKFGEKMAARFADEIIVLSKGNQRYFMENYGRKTNLIPNGMDHHDSVVPEIITAKYGVSKNDYVLYLARIVPEKGLHYLLEAFAKIKTYKKLIIAGYIDFDNEYCRQIVDMAKQDPRVHMAGLVQGHEWEELFSNCSVYVLPSDIEGMPMSLLEAISFSCRCLVSDIDENLEAGMGCVMTFERGNVDDLREKLEFLIENPSAGVYTNDGAVWKDWDSVAEMTMEVYDKVMDPAYKPTHREEMRQWQKQRKQEGEGGTQHAK